MEAKGISRDSCGGAERGVCRPAHTCECQEGWTGPHCLVRAAFDPVIYEREEGLEDLEFAWPRLEIKGIWKSLAVIAFTIMVLPLMRRRLDKWKPLSNF